MPSVMAMPTGNPFMAPGAPMEVQAVAATARGGSAVPDVLGIALGVALGSCPQGVVLQGSMGSCSKRDPRL